MGHLSYQDRKLALIEEITTAFDRIVRANRRMNSLMLRIVKPLSVLVKNN